MTMDGTAALAEAELTTLVRELDRQGRSIVAAGAPIGGHVAFEMVCSTPRAVLNAIDALAAAPVAEAATKSRRVAEVMRTAADSLRDAASVAPGPWAGPAMVAARRALGVVEGLADAWELEAARAQGA